ncbi:hypothetical protein [Streptomyces odonnellii]|uniref:hypothetical protein n=1 Tax=Streptomyces odonnellii TaxID=1417980 RepID=UPI0007C87CC8|nr:hypothetical protein [Streptomyces odonnellii]
MARQTSTDVQTDTPSCGWCHYHRGPSETAVLVEIIEVGSGAGGSVYACAPCREQHWLTPVSEISVEELLAKLQVGAAAFQQRS